MEAISKDILKSIDQKKSRFNELEAEFYSNINKVNQLKSDDPRCYTILDENDKILDQIHELNNRG